MDTTEKNGGHNKNIWLKQKEMVDFKKIRLQSYLVAPIKSSPCK